MNNPRKRVRELGITPGVLPLGKWNAITDMSGVKAGHVTLIEGEDVRTGITVILLLPPLFQAFIETTKEAIYDSLCMAETITGYHGARVVALPLLFFENNQS